MISSWYPIVKEFNQKRGFKWLHLPQMEKRPSVLWAAIWHSLASQQRGTSKDAVTGDLLAPAVWQLLWQLCSTAEDSSYKCVKCEFRVLCATAATESLLTFWCVCSGNLKCRRGLGIACFLLGCFTPQFYCSISPLTLQLFAFFSRNTDINLY